MLTLSTTEHRDLTAALMLLLSPFCYDSHREWRRDVCRALKKLFGADQATFVFDLPNQEAFFSEEVDLAVLHTYPASIRNLDERWGMADRHARLGAYDRELLWSPHLPEFYRSEYYNEWIRPVRGFHAIGLADAPTGVPTIGRMPNIVLHRWREDGPSFGDRAVDMLKLLFPAFRSSARMLHAVATQSSQLVQLLDGIGHAVYALDHAGKRHRNAAFDEMLAADPERLRLLEECHNAATAALAVRADRLSLDEVGTCAMRNERMVRTARGFYRLRANLIPHPISRSDPCAVVLLEPPRQSSRLSPCELANEFLLTPREAEVAYLLADRRRDKEIAADLGISVHTARRHTERVMQKLGVSARDDVATRLIRSATR